MNKSTMRTLAIDPYNRQSVIATLVKYGHTPVKSLEIALDAERGDPHAVKWIAMATA